MSTTIPFVFTGPTKAPRAIVASIYSAYISAQGDEDKAGDVEDGAYYEGAKTAYLDVLRMLHDDEPTVADVYPRTGNWVYPGKVV
jgi:hypothetical protein